MTTDTAPAAPASATSSPPRPVPAAGRRLPVPLALVAALLAAAALVVAFPPYGMWWLAPVGVALLAVAVHRHRARIGAALGGLTGLAFFAPLLAWTNLEIGYPPWLVLSALQAAYLALLGAATAYLSPVADRWRWSWPLLTAVAWVAQEALRARTPFGGFPWGRLAFSQDDSSLLPLAALGGAPLVTFAVALAGGLLAAGAWRLGARPWRAGRRRAGAAAVLAVLAGAVTASGLAVPLSGLTDPASGTTGGETANVAFVQGNVPRLGLDFNAQRRAVLDNHVDATIALAEAVAAGAQPRPDLVVWPENSSDIDPLRDPVASGRIDEAAAAIGAPILVGAARRDGDTLYNTGLIWNPGTGPAEFYAKQHPVPFAEYLPMRSLMLPLARLVVEDPDRIWLLADGTGFDAGDEPGVLALGPALIGNAICFEVAYDGLVRETVVGGAQLLTVQTNNATFNEAEARQQLAMVRLRAVEHGRESLMVSTVGISGFIDVDGQIYGETGFFTQDVQVRTLALTRARTPATVVGAWPELVLVACFGVAAVGAAVIALRRRATWSVEEGSE
jgi:apolipoprotein N-acyltransferase